MTVRIVVDGRDPITAPALEYLESLGVPAELIKRIEVYCPVGGPQLITATLMVRVEDLPQPVDAPVDNCDGLGCSCCNELAEQRERLGGA